MYGSKPKEVSNVEVHCKEMMFYQYLPIKMIGEDFSIFAREARLKIFDELINKCINDYVETFGYDAFKDTYIYLSVKHMYQTKNCSYNRMGYHSDGFLTDDINYIWSNSNPTIFNNSEFDLSLDDTVSMEEMERQALPENDFHYDNNVLLRLDQFNIHKVNDSGTEGMRTFFKLSFSKDKYDLIGNSHNYELSYDWVMKERKVERNIPQTVVK